MLGAQDPTRLVGWITTIVGQTEWGGEPHHMSMPSDGRITGYPAQKGVSSMAIQINGSGHVVCHN